MTNAKGLVTVILAMAIIFGAYNASIYTWTASYRTNPLTSFETLTIPDVIATLKGEIFWGTPPSSGVIFEDDMESGPNGWTTILDSGTKGWHLITNPETYEVLHPDIDDALITLPEGTPPPHYLPSAHSPTTCWWFGSETTGTYIGDDWVPAEQTPKYGGKSHTPQAGNLTSPIISLAEVTTATLTFWSWWEIESVYVTDADLMEVYISTNDGASWTLLDRLNPDVGLDGTAAKPYTSGGYPDIEGVWREYSYDLSPYTGGDILIRFLFDTWNHRCNGFRGWFIDDVTITGEVPPSYAEFIHVDKPLWVIFGVTEEDADKLAEHFYGLNFSVHIYGSGPDGDLGTADDELIEEILLQIITEGEHEEINIEKLKLIAVWVNLEPGDYGVIKDCYYHAGAVPEEVTDSFNIVVFAVEKEAVEIWESHIP